MMADLMLYAKGKGDTRFGAVDMANSTFPVPLMCAASKVLFQAGGEEL